MPHAEHIDLLRGGAIVCGCLLRQEYLILGCSLQGVGQAGGVESFTPESSDLGGQLLVARCPRP
jgi:hypothetical protein